jgi:hypothetical protein
MCIFVHISISLQVRQLGHGRLPMLFVGSSSGEVIFCALDTGSAFGRIAMGEQRAACWVLQQ